MKPVAFGMGGAYKEGVPATCESDRDSAEVGQQPSARDSHFIPRHPATDQAHTANARADAPGTHPRRVQTAARKTGLASF